MLKPPKAKEQVRLSTLRGGLSAPEIETLPKLGKASVLKHAISVLERTWSVLKHTWSVLKHPWGVLECISSRGYHS
ncbi:hypothetical protein SESBI_01097 [Sesbania bispinosa]|nr:hypothetical protein SESBI_01097 [Sesbania bispinosa]